MMIMMCSNVACNDIMFHQNDLQKLLVEEAEMNESKDSSMAQAQ